MSYFQKQINSFLLLLVVLIVVAVALASSYFQRSFEVVNTEANEVQGDLVACSRNLAILEAEHKALQKNLSDTQLDVSQYGVLYQEKETQLSEKDTTIDGLQDDIKDFRKSLQTVNNQLSTERALTTKLQGDINTYLNQIATLTAAKTAAEAAKKTAEDKLYACQNP